MKKVVIEDKKFVFNGFFKVEEAQLSFEKFNGEMSRTVTRLSLERGDAVAVLIHNISTGKLILTNQFRYSAHKNGEGWVIEILAGMAGKDEDPELAAKREIKEELGLEVSSLEHISTFYTSPGGSSERIHLYYSEVSGENAKYSGYGGLISEDEDIKAEEMTLEEALQKVKTGEIMDAKTLVGIYWLANHTPKK